MKYKLIYLLLLGITVNTFSQIPNASFEQWENNNPSQWFTANTPLITDVVTQSTDAHSGSYAVRGEVKAIPFSIFKMPPLIFPGSSGHGIPISERYQSLRGYFKFFGLEGDKLTVSVGMYKNSNQIGYGGFYVTSAPDYQEHSANIQYQTSDIPDSMLFVITICGPGGTLDSTFHAGSYYIADDVSVSAIPVSVEKETVPLQYKLEQNYPNPFNPSTVISYQLPVYSKVTLKVFDVLGKEVATLVDEYKNPGIYYSQFSSASRGLNFQLPSGIYFYQLRTSTFTETKKMIMIK